MSHIKITKSCISDGQPMRRGSVISLDKLDQGRIEGLIGGKFAIYYTPESRLGFQPDPEEQSSEPPVEDAPSDAPSEPLSETLAEMLPETPPPPPPAVDETDSGLVEMDTPPDRLEAYPTEATEPSDDEPQSDPTQYRDDQPVDVLPLNPKVIALLHAGAIRTIGDAREYLENNDSFEPLKGIGAATSKLIAQYL